MLTVEMCDVESEVFKSQLLQILDELESKRCDIKYKRSINHEIYTFLCSQKSVEVVVERFPELGHVLCSLLEDDEFILLPDVGTTFINNILWFYRPQSTLPLEKRSTHWAQAVFRSAFAACSRLHSSLFYTCNWTKEEETANFNGFISMFQNSMEHFDERGETLEAVCCYCAFLLRHDKISSKDVESYIKLLPELFVNNSSVQTFFKAISSHLINAEDGLKRTLAIWNRPYFEAVLLRRLASWLSCKQRLRRNDWLITVMSENRNNFHLGIQILHSIFVQFHYASEIELFINHIIEVIRSVKDSVFDLYPRRMSALIVLLEETPSAQLAESIMLALTFAVEAKLVSVEEALMITTHFSEWNMAMDKFIQKEKNRKRVMEMIIEIRTAMG